ncbi:MAG: TolC family protein [Gammaproteobacteria bacterium]
MLWGRGSGKSTSICMIGVGLAIGFTLYAGAIQASTLSLERAINLALTENRELLRAATLLDKSQADVDATNAAFDTHVQPLFSMQRIGGEQIKNYGVSASREFETGTAINVSATRGDTLLPNGVVVVQPAVSVSISQPLFRNAGTTVNEATEHYAESAAQTARRQYAQLRQNLVIAVVNSYTELFRLQQQVKVDELALQHATELVRLTGAYELVGRSKRLDTLRAEFDHDQAEATLDADRQRLTSAQADFAELLGYPPTSVFITEPAGWADYSGLELDAAVHVALSNRLDYAQALQDYADSANSLAVAQNQLLPEVDLTVGYQRFSQSPLPGSTIPAGGGVFVGVSGSATADEPQARAAVRKSLADRGAALDTIHIVEAQISRQVQQGISGYQQARTENAIAERAAHGAEARLRLARELFHLGRADSFAVSDAEQAYVVSQATLLNANAAVTRAGYQLSATLGTLLTSPDDVRPAAAQQP